MTEQVVIAERFRGPPQSGNGGYVGGAFASLMGPGEGDVEVTLRSPIPLDDPMEVTRTPELVTVNKGETLIAEVKRTSFELEVPAAPTMAAVKAAEPSSYSFIENVNPMYEGRRGFHPTCFCCGADLPEGLRVCAAPVGDQVAAVWPTQASWGDADGNVPDEFLWAALDCPGQFAYLAQGVLTGMLGRIAARIRRRAEAGSTCMVTAWPVRVEGRKHFAGSAVFGSDGKLVSEALAVWIGRRDPAEMGISVPEAVTRAQNQP